MVKVCDMWCMLYIQRLYCSKSAGYRFEWPTKPVSFAPSPLLVNIVYSIIIVLPCRAVLLSCFHPGCAADTDDLLQLLHLHRHDIPGAAGLGRRPTAPVARPRRRAPCTVP